MIAGLVLAGGRASRIGGGDKPLLRLAGRPMLAHVVDRLRPQVEDLALSANGDPARFAAFDLPVLPDPVAGQPGPLAGILAGLDWAAARGAASLATTPGDTPFLPPDLVARLHAAGAGGRPAYAVTAGPDGPEPHPASALWPVALAPALRAALAAGERRVRAFAEAHGAATAAFPAEGFRNVNTPADLAAAEALMYRAGQGGKRMTETIRVRVTGRVQGVAYRAWTQGEARRLGLRGWVRNEPDGAVAALFAGPPEAVAEMLATMRAGPPAAEVAEVATEPAAEHPPSGFQIRR